MDEASTSTSTTGTSTRVSTPPTSRSSSTPTVTPPTSTQTSLPTVIPDDPGELSATARTEDVETITAGDEELDVVVVGTQAPTDAERGARALETWLGGGDPGTTWETFTSDDPDADGWRWAAINQITGTVVYIR